MAEVRAAGTEEQPAALLHQEVMNVAEKVVKLNYDAILSFPWGAAPALAVAAAGLGGTSSTTTQLLICIIFLHLALLTAADVGLRGLSVEAVHAERLMMGPHHARWIRRHPFALFWFAQSLLALTYAVIAFRVVVVAFLAASCKQSAAEAAYMFARWRDG